MTKKELPLNRAIISDIALWIALALLLGWGVYLIAVRLPEDRGQNFTLHFKDANEITKGSSVRMMGLEIGMVSDVHIRQDHVDITIQTNPRSLPIPSGSTFTVLFTGLAGSKSIEIELPDVPRPTIQGQPIYLVEEPIRMKDLLNANIEITQSLEQGSQNISDFFGKRKPVEELQFNIGQAHQATVAALGHLEAFTHDVEGLQAMVADSVLSALDMVSGMDRTTTQFAAKTRPARLRPQVRNAFQGIRNFTAMFVSSETGARNTALLAGHLAKVNNLNGKATLWVERTRNAVTRFPLQQYVERFTNGTDGFSDFLNRADGFFGQDHLPALHHARQSIRRFNQQVLAWNTQADAVRQGKSDMPSSGQLSTAPHPVSPSNHAALSAPVAKPIAIVDRNGMPLGTVKNHWWEKTPATTHAAAPANPAETDPTAHKPFFLVRLFQDLWDAVRSFFQ